MNLSVVIIAKNEEKNIRRCLEALRWCDDVLVVDDHSRDRTAEIAHSIGARVLQHSFSTFASQRNWALEHGELRHDWVLMLDADEVMTESLHREMESVLPNVPDSVAGFLTCRKTMFMDCWLRFSDGFPVWIMRVVRKGRACFVDAGHGEEPAPQVDGTLEKLREPFLHYPFSKGLADWLARHNRYSTLEAELELYQNSQALLLGVFSVQRPTRRKALRALSRKLPFRSFWRFSYHYFLKAGFLDGRPGWDYAWLMALYEGMIVAKRRELQLSRICPADGTPNRSAEPMAAPLHDLPASNAASPG